jgi:hypothetical protein
VELDLISAPRALRRRCSRATPWAKSDLGSFSGAIAPEKRQRAMWERKFDVVEDYLKETEER